MAGIRRALAALACALAGAAPLAALAAAAVPVAESRIADDVRQFVRAVIASDDNQARPFAVVDKRRARIHVYDASGRWRGSSQVLLGQARGDRSAPGVGEHAQQGRVPLAERTTPAGRFDAQPGRNLHNEPIVWVDYDAAFAIHRLRGGASHALRVARLATPAADDKRLSWGCVVVPVKFYLGVVGKLLGRGPSVVYVLPENGQPGDLLADGAPAETGRLRPTGTDHPG